MTSLENLKKFFRLQKEVIKMLEEKEFYSVKLVDRIIDDDDFIEFILWMCGSYRNKKKDGDNPIEYIPSKD